MIARAAPLCALLLACSHAAPRDVTPEIPSGAPEAAVGEGASALTPAEMIEHALSRTTFGATPEDRERLAHIGIAAFLEEQLHPEGIDDGALEQQLARFDVLREAPGALVQRLVAQRQARKRNAALDETPPPPDGMEAGQPMRAPRVKREAIAQLAQAKVLRAVSSRRQLQEVLADFWFNHFNVFAAKADEAALLPDYDQRVIRANALGTFPELLRATARSPAMLVYLDNWRSAAPRPYAKRKRGLNENYAREPASPSCSAPAVRGGRILGRWPGLADDDLYKGRDLAVTTDLRSVLAAVASAQLGANEIGHIFPGFDGPALPGLL